MTVDSTSTVANEFPDPTAWIALALSILGLLVTVFLRYLDGPRVRVRVRPFLLDVSLGASITYNKGTWPIPEKHGKRYRTLPDLGNVVELAEVVIENTGRHPLTVYDVGFSWRGRRKRWWNRRIRHSVVPAPIKPQQEDETKYATGDRFRVEPSDIVVLLIDYWGTVRQNRPGHRGKIKLSASVSVAGRQRPKRSRRRQRWIITDDANSVIGGKTLIPLRSLIARTITLILLGIGKDKPYNLAYLSRSLEGHIAGSWPSEWEEQHELVEAFFKSPSNEFHLAFYEDKKMLQRTLPFNLIRVIDEHQDIIDWADIIDRRQGSKERDALELQASTDVSSTPTEPLGSATVRRATRPTGPPTR